MEANDDFLAELLLDDDSDGEQFEGFTLQEVAESGRRRILRSEENVLAIERLENDIERLENDIESEIESDSEEDEEVVGDPRVGAYQCDWLNQFEPPVVSGPIGFDNEAREIDIFLRFFFFFTYVACHLSSW